MIFLFFILDVCLSCEKSFEMTQCDNLGYRKIIAFNQESCEDVKVYENVKCDLYCEPGTFLNFQDSKLECKNCPTGTSNQAGLVRWGSEKFPWFKFLDSIINQCYLDFYNTGVIAKDVFWMIESGFLVLKDSSNKENLKCGLKFQLDLVKSGKFSIIYRKLGLVHSDNLGFYIKVNRKIVLKDLTSEETVWKQFQVNLNSGLHEFDLIVDKQFTGTQDWSLMIHSIEILGLTGFDIKCRECPLHSFSNETGCNICNFGEYFDKGSCFPCPPETFAYQGSVGQSSCKAKPSCSPKDYLKLYGPCINSARTMYFAWKPPVICRTWEADLPPSLSNLPCAPCPAGQIESQEESSGKLLCISCKKGSAKTKIGHEYQCSDCPAGTAALKVKVYNEWANLPETFLNFCRLPDGNFCQEINGWTLMTDYLSSTVYLRAHSHLVLQTSVIVEGFQGSMTVFYSIINPVEGRLEVYVNGKIVKKLQSSEKTSEIILLEKGLNLIQLVYMKSQETSEEFRIYEIRFLGLDQGSADNCVKCPSGFVSVFENSLAVNCEPCPLGFTSDQNQLKCIPCPSGFINDRKLGKCKACIKGSMSDEDRVFCIGNSFVSFENNSYYLETFSNMDSSSGKETICSALSSQNYCFFNFYGPISSKDEVYYFSVANPGKFVLTDLKVDDFDSDFSLPGSFGYAFLVKTDKSLNSDPEKCQKYQKIVNIGRELEEINEINESNKKTTTNHGFYLKYSSGDHCDSKGNKFSTFLNFICDKQSNIGWPSVKRNNCSVTIEWKSRFACPVCTESETMSSRSSCIDGKYTISKYEGPNCILPRSYPRQVVSVCEGGDSEQVQLVIYIVLCFIGMVLFTCAFVYRRETMLEIPIDDIEKD